MHRAQLLVHGGVGFASAAVLRVYEAARVTCAAPGRSTSTQRCEKRTRVSQNEFGRRVRTMFPDPQHRNLAKANTYRPPANVVERGKRGTGTGNHDSGGWAFPTDRRWLGTFGSERGWEFVLRCPLPEPSRNVLRRQVRGMYVWALTLLPSRWHNLEMQNPATQRYGDR